MMDEWMGGAWGQWKWMDGWMGGGGGGVDGRDQGNGTPTPLGIMIGASRARGDESVCAVVASMLVRGCIIASHVLP